MIEKILKDNFMYYPASIFKRMLIHLSCGDHLSNKKNTNDTGIKLKYKANFFSPFFVWVNF